MAPAWLKSIAASQFFIAGSIGSPRSHCASISISGSSVARWTTVFPIRPAEPMSNTRRGDFFIKAAPSPYPLPFEGYLYTWRIARPWNIIAGMPSLFSDYKYFELVSPGKQARRDRLLNLRSTYLRDGVAKAFFDNIARTDSFSWFPAHVAAKAL